MHEIVTKEPATKAAAPVGGGMIVKRVKLSDLKSAKYNPKGRIEKKRLWGLIRSMEEIGLIYPVAITKQNVIIEGHRRVAAARALGWEDIPALVVLGDPERIYASVNGSATRRISGNEQMQIWLNEPKALDKRLRDVHQRAQDDLGRKMMEQICKAGNSVTMWRWAQEVSHYTGDLTPAFRKKCVKWLLKHKTARLIRSMIALRMPGETIYKAIEADKPITTSYKVGK